MDFVLNIEMRDANLRGGADKIIEGFKWYFLCSIYLIKKIDLKKIIFNKKNNFIKNNNLKKLIKLFH